VQPLELLYLSQQDVIDVGLTLADAFDIVEQTLREHGAGHVENPPKPGIHPAGDAFIHAMPGYLPRKGIAGIKWVSGFSSNPKFGLASISGLIVLNDVTTGYPIAVMDCAYITALRTAAVSGVAARHLANQNSRLVGIVGAGLQGRYNLIALKHVLPSVENVKVFDTDETVMGDFVVTMAERLHLAIQPVASAEQAISAADVAVTATGKLNCPIFSHEWIRQGTLVLPVHTLGWDPQTLHVVDRLIVDDWQQFAHVMGQPGGPYAPLPDRYTELGQIVIGKKPGRQSPSERIVDFNYGMAIHDVAMATEILARAHTKRIGTPLALADNGLPLIQ